MAEDDVTMANQDIMAVDERLARLETTVATGFHEQGQRIDKLVTGFHEQGERIDKLEKKVDTGFRDQGQRIDQLEAKVTTGFFESGQRFEGVDGRMARLDDRMSRIGDRMFALESKLDIFADSIRGDIKTVLEAVTAGTEEMRRTTENIRREHEADRRLTRSILEDHSKRVRALEHPPLAPSAPGTNP